MALSSSSVRTGIKLTPTLSMVSVAPSHLSTTTTRVSIWAPAARRASTPGTAEPAVVVTSSTMKMRSPSLTSPSMMLRVPCSLVCLRIMTYGMSSSRLMATARGTAPRATPATRSESGAWKAMTLAHRARMSG